MLFLESATTAMSMSCVARICPYAARAYPPINMCGMANSFSVALNFRSARDIPGKFIYLLKSFVRRHALLNQFLCKFRLIQRLSNIVIITVERQLLKMLVLSHKLLANRRSSHYLTRP